MTDPQNENRYFIKGHIGLFDTDYLYEEESVREKRLMRGLTKRLNEIGSRPSKLGISSKTNKDGSPKKKINGSPKRRSIANRRASSIGSGGKGSEKNSVNLGLIGQKQYQRRNSSLLSGNLSRNSASNMDNNLSNNSET